MKSIAIVAIGLATMSHAVALPSLSKRALTDADILNFALTLEHLEATFYAQALQKFDNAAFTAAGYSTSIRDNFVRISNDEASHVAFLTAGLQAAGAKPVDACTYTFPYKDVKGFLGVSQILEGVGVSAYLGAASSIQNGDYLTAAGSILTVEARHNAFVRFVNGESPFPTAFDTPLAPSGVVTLATPFFASCPQGSAPSLSGFPALNVSGTASPGSTLTLTAANSTNAKFCTFLSGLNVTNVAFQDSKCTIPNDGSVGDGQTYVFLSNTDAKNVSDATVVAGPGLLDINPTDGGFNSSLVNTVSSGSGSSSGSSSSGSTSGTSSLVASGMMATVVAGLVAIIL